MTKILCDIYKSNKKADYYLYVKQQDGLRKVPPELLIQFKEPQKVMTLILTAEKKLARVDINKVMEKLNAEGFYLQLPPSPFAIRNVE